MNITVFPSSIEGHIFAPSSKSVMIRALAAALLAPGKSLLRQPSRCADALAARRIIGALGAGVREVPEGWEVDGGFAPDGSSLRCGESGLAARMFPPVAALADRELRLEGEGSLLRRPLSGLEEPLRQLGVAVTSRGGFLPLTVHGPLRGGHVVVDASLSSQSLTGLLMALPLAGNPSRIEVTRLASRSYIDVTMEVLQDFGIRAEHQDYQVFRLNGGQQYRPRNYTVEGDWSGAAFLLAAGALAGPVTVNGLNPGSAQPDRAIGEALELFGAGLAETPDGIRIGPGSRRPFAFDASGCPDLFPPLVALAAHAPGTSVLHGAKRLHHKESDRAAALRKVFGELGVLVEVDGDRMTVRGGKVNSGTVDAHGDHRLAMAPAVAALAGSGPVCITGADCVAKSYPAFFDDLRKLGGLCHE